MIQVNAILHIGGVAVASGAVVTCDFTSKRLPSDGAGNVATYAVEYGLYVSRTHQQWKDDSGIVLPLVDEFNLNYKKDDLTKIEFDALNNTTALTILKDHLETFVGVGNCTIIDPEL